MQQWFHSWNHMNMPKKDEHHSRLFFKMLWALGFFAFYMAFTGLVLPYLLRPVLEERISQTLNSPSQVESLSFNPFTLTLIASNITVPYPGDAGLCLHLDKLEATLSIFSLFQLEPRINELKLDSPVINLTLLENGQFSPQLFLDGQDAEADRNTAIFPLVIQNFSINNGTVFFKDRQKGTTQIVDNIQLAVPFVSTLPADKELAILPRLSATINGRPLNIVGETRPFSKTLLTEFALQMEELALDKFGKYITPYTGLELKNGALSTSLKLRLYREEGKAIAFHLLKKTRISDLELQGPLGTALRVASADVEIEMLPGMHRIVVNELFLDSPAISVRRATDGSIDWQNFFVALKQDGNTTQPQSLSIARARIANGSVSWHDATVLDFSPYTIRNIQAAFSNFDSEGEGKTDFSLELGEGPAKFTATGKASLKPLRIEGHVNLERVPIPLFAPYLNQMTGMSIDGVLGLKGNFAMEHGAKTIFRLGGIRLSVLSAMLPGNRTPLLTAKYLAVSEVLADLSARNVTVDAMSGSGVSVYPIRDKDGNFVLNTSAQQNTAPPAAWQMTINNLQLDSTNIILTDHNIRDTAVLPFSDVVISASTLSTQPGKQWTANVSAKPGRHGILRLETKGTLNPLAISFRLRADKADTIFLSPYLKQAANLSLVEGLLTADINGQLVTTKDRIRIEAAGKAGLNGISLTEEGKELIGWGSLRAEKFRYRNVPQGSDTFSAEKLILNGPRVSVTIGEGGTSNIRRMLVQSSASSARNPFAGLDISLSIDEAIVTSGEIRLLDKRLQPPFPFKMESIGVNIGKLSSDPTSRSELNGSVRLNGAPFVFEGAINPLNTPLAGELTIGIRELDLVPFSRYAAKYTGHPIRQGELSAWIELSLDGLDVNGRSELVLGKLDVDDRDPSSDAPRMPIKAAIGLLKDLTGDISLSLPLSGRLDDPRFDISGVTGKTVSNATLKVVAWPVRLIGGFFSIFTPSVRQERINFAPGEDWTNTKMSASLRALVESLPKRAKLELIGTADMREKQDMTKAAVVRKMRKIKYDALPEAKRKATVPERGVRIGIHVDAEEYTRLLREVYANWPGMPEGNAPKTAREMMRTLRRSISVSDDHVNDLADARAKTIREALLMIDDSLANRIKVSPSRITSGGNTEPRTDSCVLIRIN